MDLKSDSGVYAFFLDGEIIYIGQSKSLPFRICDHYRRTEPNSLGAKVDMKKAEWKVLFYHEDKKTLIEKERALIKMLQPKFNVQGK